MTNGSSKGANSGKGSGSLKFKLRNAIAGVKLNSFPLWNIVLNPAIKFSIISNAELHVTSSRVNLGGDTLSYKLGLTVKAAGKYKVIARVVRHISFGHNKLPFHDNKHKKLHRTSINTRDDLNVPSCVAVVEDYDYEADKGHDQDNLTGDEQASVDLPELDSWGQKEDAVDVKFGEALTYDQNRELQMLVQRFSEIFSDRPGDTNLDEHRIDLTCDEPVLQTPYPVPFSLQPSLKKELQHMEDVGIIRKSDSPYASPVVVVKKKDGSNRSCIDFRRLNKITVTNPQPVPSPADSFLVKSEDKYFSKLDLTKGYHLIRVSPSDVHKNCFCDDGPTLRVPADAVLDG
ncbi:hypothetical protein RRG08_053861 [Elysia crispata]|uniref:Reverse transcriptase domain-containing protein n=1 Tax=Elysia crispata TaxID=231223 RepID=A0AAE0YLT8_9GAST|nr:hypothetical protein RRG08_053861 [Elysia crispata]